MGEAITSRDASKTRKRDLAKRLFDRRPRMSCRRHGWCRRGTWKARRPHLGSLSFCTTDCNAVAIGLPLRVAVGMKASYATGSPALSRGRRLLARAVRDRSGVVCWQFDHSPPGPMTRYRVVRPIIISCRGISSRTSLDQCFGLLRRAAQS